MHTVQLELCWERMSSRLVLLAWRTLGELVWMTMPSSTSVLQAGTRRSVPSISTTHMRQAPISFMSLR